MHSAVQKLTTFNYVLHGRQLQKAVNQEYNTYVKYTYTCTCTLYRGNQIVNVIVGNIYLSIEKVNIQAT